MEPTKRRLQYDANRLFQVVGIILFAILIFYTIKNCKNPFIILPSAIIIVSILLILFLKFKTQINSLTNKQMYSILSAFIILMFLGMVWTAYIMQSNHYNDLGTVYRSIKEIFEDGHICRDINKYTCCGWSTKTSNNDYFVVYPNNQFILFLLLCYYKILSSFGISISTDLGNYMGSLLNVFMISTAIVFGFFICKKIWNNSGALMYLILSLFFLPYYINAYRFYTDTLSLPFVVSCIFLFFKLKEASSIKHRLIYSCLTGAVLAFGILLKGSMYVLLIAIIIYFVLTIKNYKQFIVLGIMLITFASINFAWHQYIDNCNWIDTSAKKELELPITHWIMMASTGTGGFRQEDVEYTLKFPDIATKKIATTEKIKERIQSYKSVINYLNFGLEKIGRAFSDGKFAQNNHLSWYKTRTWIYDYILPDGVYYKPFYNYITIFIVVIYLLILLSFFSEVKRPIITHGSFMNLCIIGMILFFWLWEIKSRYFLNFTPIYFMCAVNALDGFSRLFGRISVEH